MEREERDTLNRETKNHKEGEPRSTAMCLGEPQVLVNKCHV